VNAIKELDTVHTRNDAEHSKDAAKKKRKSLLYWPTRPSPSIKITMSHHDAEGEHSELLFEAPRKGASSRFAPQVKHQRR
jgi:hypothetical protein